jgi:hypothetical protein
MIFSCWYYLLLLFLKANFLNGIPPSRSESAEIGKKTEGILGINSLKCDKLD